jgi:hypothetical protein
MIPVPAAQQATPLAVERQAIVGERRHNLSAVATRLSVVGSSISES